MPVRVDRSLRRQWTGSEGCIRTCATPRASRFRIDQVTFASSQDPTDTPALRKERGAYFTPGEISRFLIKWAIRTPNDKVLEPAAGDAAFLAEAVTQLRTLSADTTARPTVYGVEIHDYSAVAASKRVQDFGGNARIYQCDFFSLKPKAEFDAVVGNPPYIRYQDFTGEMRARSREASLRAGVALTGLASSWAAFTIHATMFLKRGGRLALVLPAELLSVNYASPVRKFLFGRFSDIQLILFDEQVFPDAEADVVLVLADGHLCGPTGEMTVRRTKNAATLSSVGPGLNWTPPDPAAKWTSSFIDPRICGILKQLTDDDQFTCLNAWGETTLGMVTGNNRYFTLSPQRAKELRLPANELLDLSPPGSSHLRRLALTKAMLTQLGKEGRATYLFYPGDPPSTAAAAYIADGHRTGVGEAYKCRVRKIWHRVPLVPPADLLLTCMNADTPRLTANEAGVRHLNSVHGVYFHDEPRKIGCELLPLASLNSITQLHAEMVGRSYGGGILKIEPKEADAWIVPSLALLTRQADALRRIKKKVSRLLDAGKMLDAIDLVDGVLLRSDDALSEAQITLIRNAQRILSDRRHTRSGSGR